MPNLTFFVCSAIASCSCLAAFMVRRKINRSNDILEEGEVNSCQFSSDYAESSSLTCPFKHVKTHK